MKTNECAIAQGPERELKQGKMAPVYLFIRPGGYLRDEAARAITDESPARSLLREFNE